MPTDKMNSDEPILFAGETPIFKRIFIFVIFANLIISPALNLHAPSAQSTSLNSFSCNSGYIFNPNVNQCQKPPEIPVNTLASIVHNYLTQNNITCLNSTSKINDSGVWGTQVDKAPSITCAPAILTNNNTVYPNYYIFFIINSSGNIINVTKMSELLVNPTPIIYTTTVAVTTTIIQVVQTGNTNLYFVVILIVVISALILIIKYFKNKGGASSNTNV
jgi:hypothetical protein